MAIFGICARVPPYQRLINSLFCQTVRILAGLNLKSPKNSKNFGIFRFFDVFGHFGHFWPFWPFLAILAVFDGFGIPNRVRELVR